MSKNAPPFQFVNLRYVHTMRCLTTKYNTWGFEIWQAKWQPLTSRITIFDMKIVTKMLWQKVTCDTLNKEMWHDGLTSDMWHHIWQQARVDMRQNSSPFSTAYLALDSLTCKTWKHFPPNFPLFSALEAAEADAVSELERSRLCCGEPLQGEQ